MSQPTPVAPAKGDLALLQQFIAAAQALPANATLAVSGTIYTGPALVTKLQSVAAPLTAEETARQALSAAEDTRKAAEAAIKVFISSLKDAVKGYLSPTNSQLIQWGIKPAKVPAPLTVDQKMVRKAKMLATRKARGTLGKRQKAAIKVIAVPAQTVPAPEVLGATGTGSDTVIAPVGSSTTPDAASTSASTPAPVAPAR